MYYFKNYIGTGLITIIMLILISINSESYASNNSVNLSQRVQYALSKYFNNNFTVTSSNKGVVTIKGTVDRLYDKYRIFDIAEKVKGVKDIRDLVAVNTKSLPDDIIKANLMEDLRVDKSILEPNRIKVAVSNGVIKLSGTISYPREKLLAETLATWQRGALGVVDQIKVLSPRAAESNHNMKILLGDVLKYKFPLQRKDIYFSVHNGIVKIEGHTNSGWAKENLVKDFSKVKGVKKLIDDLGTNRSSASTTA